MWMIRGYKYVKPHYLKTTSDGFKWTIYDTQATQFKNKDEALALAEKAKRSKWIVRVSVIDASVYNG